MSRGILFCLYHSHWLQFSYIEDDKQVCSGCAALPRTVDTPSIKDKYTFLYGKLHNINICICVLIYLPPKSQCTFLLYKWNIIEWEWAGNIQAVLWRKVINAFRPIRIEHSAGLWRKCGKSVHWVKSRPPGWEMNRFQIKDHHGDVSNRLHIIFVKSTMWDDGPISQEQEMIKDIALAECNSCLKILKSANRCLICNTSYSCLVSINVGAALNLCTVLLGCSNKAISFTGSITLSIQLSISWFMSFFKRSDQYRFNRLYIHTLYLSSPGTLL